MDNHNLSERLGYIKLVFGGVVLGKKSPLRDFEIFLWKNWNIYDVTVIG